MAVYAYRILKLIIDKKMALLFTALFLCIPTQWFNSAVWGQSDGMLSAFFVMSFYYLLKAKYAKAIFFFSITTTIKTTFVFFLPFLGIYWLISRFPLHYFLIIPATYFAVALPSLLVGLPIDEIFYSFQIQTSPTSFARQFNILAVSIFNIYTLVDKISVAEAKPLVYGGMVLTFSLLGLFTLAIWQKQHFILQKNNQEKTLFWLLTLTISFYLVVFFLPYMHDRYYYFATMSAFLYMVLSLSYFTSRPFLAWLPFVILEINSLMTYFKTLKLSYLEIFGSWEDLMHTPIKYFMVPLLAIGLLILLRDFNYLLKSNTINEDE